MAVARLVDDRRIKAVLNVRAFGKDDGVAGPHVLERDRFRRERVRPIEKRAQELGVAALGRPRDHAPSLGLEAEHPCVAADVVDVELVAFHVQVSPPYLLARHRLEQVHAYVVEREGSGVGFGRVGEVAALDHNRSLAGVNDLECARELLEHERIGRVVVDLEGHAEVVVRVHVRAEPEHTLDGRGYLERLATDQVGAARKIDRGRARIEGRLYDGLAELIAARELLPVREVIVVYGRHLGDREAD